MKFTLCFILSICHIYAIAQTDTTLNLEQVIVKGFETQKSNLKTPAALSSLQANQIQKYQNASILPVFNEQTGIRMEERSPGSYRISIRGSSIRSPFGVRNVKVYYNGIPFSDANGTTYFNQIDLNAIGNIEILKGPSSSIYGAGYGGVINMDIQNANKGTHISTGLHLGQWGTFNQSYDFKKATEKLNLSITHSRINSDGYRNHSATEGNRTSLNFNYFLTPKHSLNFTQLLSKIDYKTPGGLTLAQMEANRKAARPATATAPGSVEQNSSINQNLSLSGLSHQWKISNQSGINTSIFYIKSHLQNPFITSFEDRHENTLGYRSVFNTTLNKMLFIAGIEGIFTHSEFDVKQNNAGVPGLFLYNTKLKSSQLTHFAQVSYPLPWQMEITAGASLNFQQYNNATLSNELVVAKDNIGIPITPRIALLKSFKTNTSVYYSFSNGYSSPTAQEMTANFENFKNTQLKAEIGSSHELGIKKRWNPNIKSDLAVYFQNVNHALIRNVLDNGGEYFENTGHIVQKGLEWSNVALYNFNTDFMKQLRISQNFTINDYTFGEYINEGKNLKGYTLPGTSKFNSYTAVQMHHSTGLYLYTDINYLSKTPLNSLNNVWANETVLSSARLGWNKNLQSKWNLNLYTGVENMFNKSYSLGYDFNAFGSRFYNPAPLRNFNFGFKTSYQF